MSTRRVQPIAATHSTNFSPGVLESKVFLGRSLSWRAMALSFAWLCGDRSVPRGRYWRSSRLVFSFEPRYQGDRGSQK